MGWLLPILMAVFGGALRFVRLGSPHSVVFDETYYVKDAWTMLMTGEARNWPKTLSPANIPIDTLFAQGDTNQWLASAEYVVHPPIGKWMIAIGLKLFGGADSAFAWRFSTALVGTLAILVLCRVALRLFHNLPIALMAGFLLSIDGLGITMSRTSLLDNFIMIFVLCAFACLLAHRDRSVEKLQAAYLVDSQKRSARFIPVAHRWGKDKHHTRFVLNETGPVIFFSWWRVVAAVFLGLATGTKWSGIYFFAAFAVLTVMWDAWERRQAGYRSWFLSGIWKDGLFTGLMMLPIWAGTYLASWTSWFMHSDSYMHNWAAENPSEGITWLPESLRSFVEYHRQMWDFHTTLETPHSYMANPLTWPLQTRPTSFYWEELNNHPGLCSIAQNSKCISAITSLGNPLLWWLGSACVLIGIVVAAIIRQGDWRIWAVLIGFIGGWLPWAQYLHRTTFTFYSIVILPWIVLAICYMADWLRQNVKTSTYHGVVWGTLGILAVVSLFFYPIWTAMPVPYEFWLVHMWFPSWI
ncbi:dolichyl-phosphate-mannose--protein mannosyltransferase [Bifidobacterium sp.]|uniref:dolichyl-phosphate-mannose--protein mannosyltransferase n=1 Tax=Bifidobacterium sp. TaxID=41200 RepID=UPI0025BA010A|nr:phospholipid carrier-dependent glycosyltransferase [Bifidobacterium sp.]MCI1636466.1 phospholipid carrier-dependent glycosyltransferase [Bifidobacterium sp.]